MERDKNLSLRKAAKLYSVAPMTLHERRKGIRSRAEVIAKSRNLDPLEEQVIVQRVLDLSAQGFSPGLNVVEDMANLLREARGASPVGKCWARNFIQRQLELKTCWSRPYDYQRAKCEDPKIIGAWFDLFRNMVGLPPQLSPTLGSLRHHRIPTKLRCRPHTSRIAFPGIKIALQHQFLGHSTNLKRVQQRLCTRWC